MKKILNINYLSHAIILFILGTILLIFNEKFYKGLVIILLIILGLDIIKNILLWLVKDKKNIHRLIINFFLIIIIIYMLHNKDIPYSIFPILTGIYIISNGIIKSIMTYNLFVIKEKGKIYNLISSIILLILGISLVFSPLMHLKNVLFLFSIYTLLLSFNYFIDFINNSINFKRRIHICLPAIIDALIPYGYFKKINKFKNETLNISKEKNKPDMEILIHVSDKKNGKMGHVDFLYNNIVYSYGNYDHETYKLFETIGDGVLFKTKKNEYIKFCIEDSNKTVFVYGIKLNDKQKKSLEKQLIKMEENLYPWSPKTKKNYYAERLNKKTKTNFYKFKKGKFKKYFLLNNNCAYFTNKIIGATGTNILKINDVITPGTCQEYLNNELNKKNGIVISCNIYNNTNYKNLSLND